VALVTHQSNVPDLLQVNGWRRELLETLLRLSCEGILFCEKRLQIESLWEWVWLTVFESRDNFVSSVGFGYLFCCDVMLPCHNYSVAASKWWWWWLSTSKMTATVCQVQTTEGRYSSYTTISIRLGLYPYIKEQPKPQENVTTSAPTPHIKNETILLLQTCLYWKRRWHDCLMLPVRLWIPFLRKINKRDGITCWDCHEKCHCSVFRSC
jgi:hypothetical protein